MTKITNLISLIIFTSFILSCGVPNNNPTPSPSLSNSPTSSPSSLTIKYTREDYIRIFTCTLALGKELKPSDRGRIAAHLSLTKNDDLWKMGGEERSKAYDVEDVENVSIPLGCK